MYETSTNIQTDRAALSSTSSIRAKDALKQHALPALRHPGRVPLLWHNHQRSLPKSGKSETKFTKPNLRLLLLRHWRKLWRIRKHRPVQGLLLPGRPWSWLEILESTHSPNEIMSKILLKWHLKNCLLLLTDGKVKKQQLQRILRLFDKVICSICTVIVHIKTGFYLPH